MRFSVIGVLVLVLLIAFLLVSNPPQEGSQSGGQANSVVLSKWSGESQRRFYAKPKDLEPASGLLKDPELALTSLLSKRSEGNLAKAEHLMKKWAQEDRVAASDYLVGLRDWRSYDLVFAVTSAWEKESFEDIKMWLNSIESSNGLKGTILLGLADALAKSDASNASILFQELAREGVGLDAAQQFARTWAEQAPGEALEWARKFPKGGAFYENVVAVVAEEWAESDPQGATSAFGDFAIEPENDVIVSKISIALVKTNPEVAVDWVQTIQNQQIRTEAFFKLAEQWIQSDPLSFEQFLVKGESPEKMSEVFVSVQEEYLN